MHMHIYIHIKLRIVLYVYLVNEYIIYLHILSIYLFIYLSECLSIDLCRERDLELGEEGGAKLFLQRSGQRSELNHSVSLRAHHVFENIERHRDHAFSLEVSQPDTYEFR